MGLKLQGQGINMMLLKHKWSAVRSHNHTPHLLGKQQPNWADRGLSRH